MKFTLLAILITAVCAAAADSHYIREGASGAADGSNWTDAWTDLPGTFTRGDTYYVADGTYGAHVFNTATNGSTWIYIKKATTADHGTETGWNAGYGDGQGVFTNDSEILRFMTDYWEFDGQVGGGPGSWTNGLGFKLTPITPGYNIIYAMLSYKYGGPADRPNVNYITFAHVEWDSRLTPVVVATGYPIDCTAAGAVFSHLTVDHCYIHDIGGYMYLSAVDDATIQYTHIARTASDETHHGSGARVSYSNRLIYRYNLVADIFGTGWLGAYEGTCDDWEIYGNVFYGSPTFTVEVENGVIYTVGTSDELRRNWKIYNNTFCHINLANMVNLAFGVSNNVAFNNVFHNLLTTPAGMIGLTNSDWNLHDTNVVHGEPNGQNWATTAGPLVDWTNQNFYLVGQTVSGTNLGSPYDVDGLGNTRGNWDRGAYEFATNYCATPTITAPSNTVPTTATITCSTGGATILWKTNGSYAVYSAPLSIAGAVTLSAYATNTAYADSAVATAVYTNAAAPAPSTNLTYRVGTLRVQTMRQR